MVNIKLYKNFIKDLSGLDSVSGKRVSGIVGFYVLGIKDSGVDDEMCEIFYKGKADFINIDGKSNQLATNLYIGNSESILQHSDFRKFSYVYEILYDGEVPTIVDLNEKYRLENPNNYIPEYNVIQFKNDEIYQDGSNNTIKKLKDKLGNDFRIAFDVYSSSYNDNQDYNDEKLDNSGFLSGLIAYEGFRPIIDISSLKVMVNLISVTLSENPIFHVHDLSKETIQINGTTRNQLDYQSLSVNSLTEFVNQNFTFNINQTDVCYEDWNLINIKKE